MKGRAFSLMELMVALVLAGIIGGIAVGAGMNINRALVDTRRRAVVWDETKRLEEALLSRVQEAGGDPLAPHQAIVVEDNCTADGTRGLPDCAGADRLTVFTVKPIRTCAVIATGAVLKAGPADSDACCVEPGADPLAFEGQAALLIPTTVGAPAISVFLHTVNGASCQVDAPPGQGNVLPTALVNGTLALVDVRTIFPEKHGAEYHLMQWVDVGAPANGSLDPGEAQLIADRVFDFQIALGYDGNPEDGDIVDNGNNSDEWAANAVGETGAIPAPATADQLRMIDIAIVVGVKANGFNTQSIRLLNRATPVTVPGFYLAATRGQVGFRNLNVSVP